MKMDTTTKTEQRKTEPCDSYNPHTPHDYGNWLHCEGIDHDPVTLELDEIHIAVVGIRKYLAGLRNAYRRDISRGYTEYAERCVMKFDAALNLYAKLGGDVDDVLDIEDKAGAR